MHSAGLFFSFLSLIPHTILALPKGTGVPTYNEIAKFWHNELNITASPPSGIETISGYSLPCQILETIFRNLNIQPNEPQYEARRTANW